MVPNIVFAIKRKDGFVNKYHNKALGVLEQVGRYACFALMIFNIPFTYFNFWFDYALVIYLAVNGVLCLAYVVIWIVCWNNDGKAKALTLSIIPSAIFLFSGIVLLSVPLIAFAVIFAIGHITISYKNSI